MSSKDILIKKMNKVPGGYILGVGMEGGGSILSSSTCGQRYDIRPHTLGDPPPPIHLTTNADRMRANI